MGLEQIHFGGMMSTKELDTQFPQDMEFNELP